MSRILLVHPPPTKSATWIWVPLGLAYIGAVLKEEGHYVKGIDLRCQSIQDYIKALNDHWDWVGFSIDTTSWTNSLPIIRIAKEAGLNVILGGPHPSIAALEVIRERAVDVVVIGEGEETIKEIVSGKPLPEVNGIVYKKNGVIKQTPPRPPISNLHDLPLPDRDIFPLDFYLKYSFLNFPLPVPNLHLTASRGCPFNCKFCAPTVQKMFGRGLRYRSTNSVINELLFLIDRYKIRSFHFEDDCFTANKKWVLEFCRAKTNSGIDLPFRCLSRVDTLDEELIKALKKAGCLLIMFGFESGSQRILNYYNKHATPEQNLKAAELCRENGILVVANMMVGAPYETIEDLEKTLQMFHNIDPELSWASITSPLPGTFLHEECLQNGILIAKEMEDYDRMKTEPKIKTVIPMKTIKKYRDAMERRIPNLRLYLSRSVYRDAVNRWLYSIIKERNFIDFLFAAFSILMRYKLQLHTKKGFPKKHAVN